MNSDYATQKCNEILRADLINEELKELVLKHEVEFKKTLSKCQLKAYLELESLIVRQEANTEYVLFTELSKK